MFRVSLKVGWVAEVVDALRLHLGLIIVWRSETVDSGFLLNLQSFHLSVIESVG